MKSLSQQQTNSVISLLQQGLSSRNVASITGFHYSIVLKICIKHCPDLPKPFGGHPLKLSSTVSRHIVHLIGSGKAETPVDVSRILQDTLNTSISAETVQRNLKSTGFKSVVKSKHPLLSVNTRRCGWTLLWHIKTGLWRTENMLYDQIKLKSIA